MSIKLLDQNTINQIAAGEVIDRPASVVKELLENAIDAAASIVTVEIKDGGVSLIRITDNGTGIEKKDIKVAFLRHSTSKIKSAVDLLTVASLGFRGEALSSIAAVAMVELMTKTKSELLGIRYVIEGGKEISMEEVGIPDGTTFVIRNLFFNTPARRKFLKSSQTEAGYIGDIVEKLALSHPEVSIRFIVNGQTRLHTSGNGKLKDVIYNIYGRDITANLLEVNAENQFMSIKGYIGKPLISRGNRAYENYFINGRYIKNSLINKAIEESYKSFIMQHKYPFTVLALTIKNELLDVNVHPSKMELRFRNSDEIYPFVLKSVLDVLSGKQLIPHVSLDQEEKKEKPEKHITLKPAEAFEKNRANTIENETKAAENIEKVLGFIKHSKNNDQIPSKIDKIASFNYENKIITNDDRKPCEKTDNLEVKIDNDEQVEVQSIAKTVKEEQPEAKPKTVKDNYPKVNQQEVQTALEEKNTELKPKELKPKASETNYVVNEPAYKYTAETVGEQISLFDEEFLTEAARLKHKLIGQVFDTYWIVQYGNSMYIIDQHAAHEKILYERLMKRVKEKKALGQAVNPPIIISLSMTEEDILKKNMETFTKLGYEIEFFGGNEYCIRAIPYDLFNINKQDLFIDILDSINKDTGKSNPDMILERAASMSCKAAVKGNNKLSTAEANELIDELLTLENPYNCPHGRPTIIDITKTELEKKFKRIL